MYKGTIDSKVVDIKNLYAEDIRAKYLFFPCITFPLEVQQ